MRKPGTLAAALATTGMIASTMASTPALAQRVEVGNAATVIGEVELSNEEIRRPRQVERRERLAWGDEIETGRRSQLQILLLDRSTFGIGARSSMRIDEFVYDPNEGRSLVASFFRGAMRFFSGLQDDDNEAEITTPAGRIGIRGTAVDLLVGDDAEDIAKDEEFVGSVRSDDDEATFVVLRGPGAATAGGLTPGVVDVESAGVTVTLDEPGLAAYIPRAGVPPIGPFRISNAGLAQVQQQLAPEVARAAGNNGGGGNGLLRALIPVAAAAVAAGILLSDGDDDQVITPQGPDTVPSPGSNNNPPSGPQPNNPPPVNVDPVPSTPPPQQSFPPQNNNQNQDPNGNNPQIP